MMMVTETNIAHYYYYCVIMDNIIGYLGEEKNERTENVGPPDRVCYLLDRLFLDLGELHHHQYFFYLHMTRSFVRCHLPSKYCMVLCAQAA